MGLLLLKLQTFVEKQTFDCKLLYILGKTVQDIVQESNIRQIASSQMTSF